MKTFLDNNELGFIIILIIEKDRPLHFCCYTIFCYYTLIESTQHYYGDGFVFTLIAST